MNIAMEFGRLLEAMERGVMPDDFIAQAETDAGNVVVRPGARQWLPTADWKPSTVCSVRGDEARLVLLHAKMPGNGAFTRLLAALHREGLSPVVVEPTPKFQSTLLARQWREKVTGRGRSRERQWRPQRRCPA